MKTKVMRQLVPLTIRHATTTVPIVDKSVFQQCK